MKLFEDSTEYKDSTIGRVMKAFTIFLLTTIFCSTTTITASSIELGLDYGKEFRGNTDLQQYEVYLRQPLPYKKQTDSGLAISSALEFGVAFLQESGSDNDPAGRFSLMPQLFLSPHENITCVVGFGAGFMVGNTEFTEHNLGGEFLLASKLGLQFLLGQGWNVGYFFYHQSNAGIYEYNASLNMHSLTFSYSF